MTADAPLPSPDEPVSETRMALLAELAEALAADLADAPQRCGHASDPMCCPYENFPTLATFFATSERPPDPDPNEFDPWDLQPFPPPPSGADAGDTTHNPMRSK